jgi:DNA-binding transcriptional LysR family regulator
VQIRHLEYFVAVADELNFTRAAARLHMAQPPLSTQIRKLERELGVKLFDRSRRAITLTVAGRALLPEARRLLDDIDRTTRIVRHAGDGTVGRLAVGFVPTAASGALPGFLRRYRQEFPDVELTLQERAPDDLIHDLLERRIDAGFLFRPFDDSALAWFCANTEHLVAALPAQHELAARETVDVRDLAREPLILPIRHRAPGLFSRISEMLESAGVDPVVIQREVWMMQTILGLVAAGIGAAIVPSSAAMLHREGVVYRPLLQVIAPLEMAVAWRRDHTSPTLRAFTEAVRARPMDISLPSR